MYGGNSEARGQQESPKAPSPYPQIISLAAGFNTGCTIKLNLCSLQQHWDQLHCASAMYMYMYVPRLQLPIYSVHVHVCHTHHCWHSTFLLQILNNLALVCWFHTREEPGAHTGLPLLLFRHRIKLASWEWLPCGGSVYMCDKERTLLFGIHCTCTCTMTIQTTCTCTCPFKMGYH